MRRTQLGCAHPWWDWPNGAPAIRAELRYNGNVALHCRHCGTDNIVAPEVVGKLCENCGKAVYTPEFEREIQQGQKPPKALADRTGVVLGVTCPHCQFRNEFPGLGMVYIFLCDECGEPVAVEEPVQ
jgi:hypothetical protein